MHHGQSYASVNVRPLGGGGRAGGGGIRQTILARGARIRQERSAQGVGNSANTIA